MAFLVQVLVDVVFLYCFFFFFSFPVFFFGLFSSFFFFFFFFLTSVVRGKNKNVLQAHIFYGLNKKNIFLWF